MRTEKRNDMRVTVDQQRCIGSGMCVLAVGEVFDQREEDGAAQLLQEYPNLRVITASLEDNQMQVYSKYSIRVRNPSDLLSIIEDRYFSDRPVKKGGE